MMVASWVRFACEGDGWPQNYLVYHVGATLRYQKSKEVRLAGVDIKHALMLRFATMEAKTRELVKLDLFFFGANHDIGT